MKRIGAIRPTTASIRRPRHGEKVIRPLRSEADYDAALDEVERYFENDPKPGTPEADRLDLLALIIEDYERKYWPIDPPDAIDAIRYRMEASGYPKPILVACPARANAPRTS